MTNANTPEGSHARPIEYLLAGYGAAGLLISTSIPDVLVFHDSVAEVSPKFVVGAILAGATEVYRRRTRHTELPGSDI